MIVSWPPWGRWPSIRAGLVQRARIVLLGMDWDE